MNTPKYLEIAELIRIDIFILEAINAALQAKGKSEKED